MFARLIASLPQGLCTGCSLPEMPFLWISVQLALCLHSSLSPFVTSPKRVPPPTLGHPALYPSSFNMS